jgi:hypothetical protein
MGVEEASTDGLEICPTKHQYGRVTMNEFNRIDPDTKIFEVQVGLARVRVEAHSPEEAIHAARQAFCREMPRMWDVIQRLAADRFIVQPALKVA